jgi:hypothetical protein
MSTYHQIVENHNIMMNKESEVPEQETHSGSSCAICQGKAHNYYHHWACLKFFAICSGCYANLHMTQCTLCKGVGSANDVIVNKEFSASARACPSCREKLAGIKRAPIAV